MKRFKVTEDHMKLLKRMYVGWQHCEYGAPEINPKRPYGNSFVIGDIAEILEWDYEDEDDLYEDESIQDKAWSIHSEMETVLQILVDNASISIGSYINKSRYSSKGWTKEGDIDE